MKKRNDWLKEFLEEAKAILVEGRWNASAGIIETYHALGKLINENKERLEQEYRGGFATALHEKLDVSERTLYYAVQFAERFKTIDEAMSSLPEGKALSWRKIVKMLPSGKYEECRHENTRMLKLCVSCGKRL